MKVSVVNSAGGSFYSSYVGFEVLLQLRWWFFCYTYVGGSFCCSYEGDCVAVVQFEVSATLMQVKISAANIWVTIFIEVMPVGVSVAII